MTKLKIFLFSNILSLLAIIFGSLFLNSMSPLPSNIGTVDIEALHNLYNTLDFYSIYTNYIQNPEITNLIFQKPSTAYILVSSLYRVNQYVEVIKFSNLNYLDNFFDYLISSYVAFSLSEISNYSESQKILEKIFTNIPTSYLKEEAKYYIALNLINQNNEEGAFFYLRSVDRKYITPQKLERIITPILGKPSKIALLAELISSKNFRVNRKTLEIISKVDYSKLGEQEKKILGESLIKLGSPKLGYEILSTLNNLPQPLREYYNAWKNYYENNLENTEFLLKKLYHQKYISILSKFKITLTDIDFLSVNLAIKKKNTKKLEFYISKGELKLLYSILKSYKQISKEIYYKALTKTIKMSYLSDTTINHIQNFISYTILENNLEILKKFIIEFLPLYKNTTVYPQLAYLKYIFSEDNYEKARLISEIIINHPLTLEYVRICENFSNYTLKDLILSNIVEQYMVICSKTNISDKDLDRFIGISVFMESTGHSELLVRNQEILKKLPKMLISIRNQVVKESTNVIPNKVLEKLYSDNIMFDVMLETTELYGINNFKYINFYKRYKIPGYVVRAIEKYSFQSKLFVHKALFTTAFAEELYPAPFVEYVSRYLDSYSKNTLIDNSLVYSIMRQESRYLPNLVSISDAIGLMQLIKPTAEATSKRPMEIHEIFNIENNIHLGIKHLVELFTFFKKYSNKELIEMLVISSYNAGSTATLKWAKTLSKNNLLTPEIFPYSIRFQETRNYLRFVKENKFIYEKLLSNNLIAMVKLETSKQ